MSYFAKASFPETCAPCQTLHEAIVLRPGALSRALKESIHLAVARAGPAAASMAPESALLGFSVALALDPTSIGRSDFDRLRGLGFTDEQLLEAILATSFARFYGALTDGLGAGRDPSAAARPERAGSPARPAPAEDRKGPYLRSIERKVDEFEPFAYLRSKLGFVPKFFQAQGLKPEPIEAQVRVLR